MILVSIVVATYRRETELKRALCSLAMQSYQNIEIILIDDNADEIWNKKVSEIVLEFQENFPKISLNVIVNNYGLGSAKTRNVGIDSAKGEFITFLDDDDLYLPDKVKNQVEFMKSGGYQYSITDLILYNENDKEVDRRIRSYMKDNCSEALKKYHLQYHMTGTDTMMFEKDYLIKIGGFDPIDVGDEFYLMQKAIDGRGKFGYLPGCDVKAYVHTGCGGLSSGDGKIKGENALYEYKKKYFPELSRDVIRYIKMRHFAVLAFAEIRRKKYGAFLKNAVKAFLISPVACIRLLVRGQ